MATLSNTNTVPMTPVPQSNAEFEAARRSYEYEAAKKAHDEELAKGGAIKRQGYESTGIGATVGSTVGAVAGGLTRIPGAAALGGATGAAVGEAVEQGAYRLTEGPGSITAEESLTGMGQQTALGVAAEGGGQVLRMVKPIRYVQPAVLTPEQVQRKAILDRYKIPYLPHEISESGFHKLLADIGESGILSKDVYADLLRDANAARKLAMYGIADQVGVHVPPNELAHNVVKVVQDTEEAMRTAFDTVYGTIRDELKYTKPPAQMVPTGKMVPNKTGLVGPGTEVPEMVSVQPPIEGGRWADISKTKTLFDVAKKRHEDAAEGVNQAEILKQPWYETVSRASRLPEFAQWNDAHVFLKDVRAEIRRVEDAAKSKVDTTKMADLGVLRSIEEQLEADLRKSLADSPDSKHRFALTLWDTVQRDYHQMSADFRNDTILKFVQKTEEHGGEKAMQEFILTLPPEDVQKVLTATAADPATQHSLKRSFLQIGIERAGGQADDMLRFDPKKARTFLFGKDELTARKTDMLIPRQTQQNIAEFLDAADQQIAASKTGKTGTIFMAMKGSQIVIGGAAGLWGGKALYEGDMGEALATGGGAVAFTMGPGWIAAALQKPAVAKLLIEGLRYSGSQTRVGKVVQQLARLDESFARALQLGTNVSGALPGPPVQKEPGSMMQMPSAFPMEK